jgi:UDP-N-acetylglucosamine 2-epimerase
MRHCAASGNARSGIESFSIVPDYDLNIMQPGQGLTEITCRILEGLKPILESFRPDVVLVHGDTTTTIAASLAAFYQRIPVGHVEQVAYRICHRRGRKRPIAR